MNTEILMLMSDKRKTSHIFHLIMTVITAGIWIPIWLLCGVNNWIENKRLFSKIRKLELATKED